jgi:hypothetical protein
LSDLNVVMRICSFLKKWGWNGQLQVMAADAPGGDKKKVRRDNKRGARMAPQ